MKRLPRLVLAVLLAGLVTGAGCGGGDDGNGGGGGASCHCDFSDQCEEYTSGCATTECESNGVDVKSAGGCSPEGFVAVCRCPSEDYNAYYTSDVDNPQEECEFWCDDGSFETL